MEDNQQDQTRTAPVMDIQPPKPVVTPIEVQSTAPEVPTTEASPAVDGPTEAPLAEAPPEAAVEGESPAPEATPAPDASVPATAEPSEATPLVATPAAHHSDHKAPLGAIIVAIVIAVALAVVAVLAYSKQQDKTKTNTTTTTQTQTQTPKATAQDVDDTTKAVDSSLSGTDDTKDFDSNSLSDSSLNL